MDGIKKIDLIPYEIRIASAYLYLGEKEKAVAMMNYYLGLCRPKGWNEFGEVVRYNYRDPGYLGDMPHTWAASIFVNFVRSMFVMEKESSLILGAGVDENGLDKGISVKKLPTWFGDISYSIQQDKNSVKFEASGTANPEKGFVLKSPYLNKPVKSVTINGKESTDFKGRDIPFNQLPSQIVINY